MCVCGCGFFDSPLCSSYRIYRDNGEENYCNTTGYICHHKAVKGVTQREVAFDWHRCLSHRVHVFSRRKHISYTIRGHQF